MAIQPRPHTPVYTESCTDPACLELLVVAGDPEPRQTLHPDDMTPREAVIYLLKTREACSGSRRVRSGWARELRETIAERHRDYFVDRALLPADDEPAEHFAERRNARRRLERLQRLHDALNGDEDQ